MFDQSGGQPTFLQMMLMRQLAKSQDETAMEVMLETVRNDGKLKDVKTDAQRIDNVRLGNEVADQIGGDPNKEYLHKALKQIVGGN